MPASTRLRGATPRPLPPAREHALRRRIARIARIACLTATRFLDPRVSDVEILPDLPLAPAVAIAHNDVVADAHALLARLASAD